MQYHSLDSPPCFQGRSKSYLTPMGGNQINYKKQVGVWYRQVMNFFKVIILIFIVEIILPSRLHNILEHKFNISFLCNKKVTLGKNKTGKKGNGLILPNIFLNV